MSTDTTSARARASRTEPVPQAAETRTRRNFLKLGVGVLTTVTLAEITGAGLLFLTPRSLDGEFGGVVDAGTVDSFPTGSVTEFPAGRFFLVRAEDGGFLAVYRRCTHLGCAVSWEAGTGEFVCPCHGSHFDLFGVVQNPPAPAALDTFPIEIAEGVVRVDTGHAQSRDLHAPASLAYA
jgi:cytochrome b6-f complex iron-sulfur subunit